jgi:5-methylthioadenosine/S-adenosylhomocysteine deaminase
LPARARPRSSGWSRSASSTGACSSSIPAGSSLVRRKPSLVCAPSSSLHNGYGNFLFGKLPELLALGVNVAVGSDHASSGIVDMSQEIRLACCCYKETRLNPRVMPPETGLEMATVNGAKAALMDARIGSIEVGKEADIVLFDTNRPEWQPLINPVSNLVYSATGDSVRDVFVMGEQVVAGGRLTRIDQDRVLAEVPAAVARFGKRLKFDRMVQLKWPVT